MATESERDQNDKDRSFLNWCLAVGGLPEVTNKLTGQEARQLFDKGFSPVAVSSHISQGLSLAEAAGTNTIGVLVLAAYAPLVLDQVVGSFDERFKFFLHLDAKKDLAAYAAKIANMSRIVTLDRRINVFWGGFSMVEAEISLIEAALADPTISDLILISDDTAPIVGPDEVFKALKEQPNRITCIPNGRPKHWYEDFFYTDSNFGALRGIEMDQKQFKPDDWQNIQRLEKLRARGKMKLETMYFGRQWWALSRASATAILDFLKNHEHYMESFRFSLFPDETFFPTAYRFCFPSTATLNIPTYADYGRHVHPWQYSSAEEIRATKFGEEHLFVRKLKVDKPDIVVDLAKAWTA